MKKWLKRLSLVFMSLLILLLVAIHWGMSTMRFSDEEAEILFEERGFDGEVLVRDILDTKVKLVIEKEEVEDSVLLVFVHGAPGTWDAFKDYMIDPELYRHARIIAYDRPGYGGSTEEAMPGIEAQADILEELIKEYGLKKNVLIGHSYGGPIVGKVGAKSGRGQDEVIMIAPLIDPQNEPLFWYSYFSYWKLTSWLLPRELVVAGTEKFAHAEELKLMREDWNAAQCQFTHVHGLKDGLAPGRENVDFAVQNIPKGHLDTIVYNDKGHLVIWTDYTLMKEIILSKLSQ